MKRNTKKLTTCAIFAAIICVVTTFVAVPAPSIGNINLGDAFILCAAWLLGPLGAVAAGLGACLADLFAGYAIYAPATLVIKALMALACHYTFVGLARVTNKPAFSRILSALLAELIMVVGYFAYESIIYGFFASVASIPFNLIQGGCCLVIGSVCAFLLFSNKAIQNFSREFICTKKS